MEIKMIDINKIIPYYKNPRNNDKTIKPLMESIKKYGCNVPLVLDKNNIIICGHARYKALKKLNYINIPCIIKSMTKKKAKEYRIIDNKIHEKTKWKIDDLGMELNGLNIEDMRIYFDDIDIKISNINGKSKKDINNEDMIKAANKLKIEKKADNHIALICPECAYEYYIDRKEL